MFFQDATNPLDIKLTSKSDYQSIHQRYLYGKYKISKGYWPATVGAVRVRDQQHELWHSKLLIVIIYDIHLK